MFKFWIQVLSFAFCPAAQGLESKEGLEKHWGCFRCKKSVKAWRIHEADREIIFEQDNLSKLP